MDKMREVYEQMDKSLDQLAAVEENCRSTVYILKRLQDTYDKPGMEGMEMIAVWITKQMETIGLQLRTVLDEMDEQVMRLVNDKNGG